jgi:hypothetical protein
MFLIGLALIGALDGHTIGSFNFIVILLYIILQLRIIDALAFLFAARVSMMEYTFVHYFPRTLAIAGVAALSIVAIYSFVILAAFWRQPSRVNQLLPLGLLIASPIVNFFFLALLATLSVGQPRIRMTRPPQFDWAARRLALFFTINYWLRNRIVGPVMLSAGVHLDAIFPDGRCIRVVSKAPLKGLLYARTEPEQANQLPLTPGLDPTLLVEPAQWENVHWILTVSAVSTYESLLGVDGQFWEKQLLV